VTVNDSLPLEATRATTYLKFCIPLITFFALSVYSSLITFHHTCMKIVNFLPLVLRVKWTKVWRDVQQSSMLYTLFKNSDRLLSFETIATQGEQSLKFGHCCLCKIRGRHRSDFWV